MAGRPRDDDREQRIHDEIIVDAYGPEEQALGWYYSLEARLQFPFRARCTTERRTSPLRVGEAIEVTGMASEAEREHDMFVLTRWRGRTLAVPLAQLTGIDVDEAAQQAIEDWRYWVDRGYEL